MKFKLFLEAENSVLIGESTNLNMLVQEGLGLFFLKNDISIVDEGGNYLMKFDGSKFND